MYQKRITRGSNTTHCFVYLHGRVVEGNEGGEQIQVACGEHQGKQDLTLPRNTCSETERKCDVAESSYYNSMLMPDLVPLLT